MDNNIIPQAIAGILMAAILSSAFSFILVLIWILKLPILIVLGIILLNRYERLLVNKEIVPEEEGTNPSAEE